MASQGQGAEDVWVQIRNGFFANWTEHKRLVDLGLVPLDEEIARAARGEPPAVSQRWAGTDTGGPAMPARKRTVTAKARAKAKKIPWRDLPKRKLMAHL